MRAHHPYIAKPLLVKAALIAVVGDIPLGEGVHGLFV